MRSHAVPLALGPTILAAYAASPTTWIERAPSPDPDASMVVNDVPRDPVTNPKYSSLWPVFLFACFLCSPYFPCLPLEHGCVCRTRC